MSTRTLQKWHGAGNDFLVEVDGPNAEVWWTGERAARVCHRSLGVGADGLLLALSGEPTRMVLYNADGSRAEMSGNGARCLAGALRRARRASWTSLVVATDAGERLVTLRMEGDAGEGSVAMGAVTFGPTPAGALGAAHVGNPHVVVRDDPTWSDATREALARGWSDDLGGANVEFVTVRDARHVGLRVIERGVGWTLACGTGSCASAAVLHRAGEVGAEVVVENPGGDLTVTLVGDQATLAGPVRFVADVEWSGA